MYTNSVASAYLFPLRGLEGAGEGGKSCPSRSILEKALPRDGVALGELDCAALPEGPAPGLDMVTCGDSGGCTVGIRDTGHCEVLLFREAVVIWAWKRSV